MITSMQPPAKSGPGRRRYAHCMASQSGRLGDLADRWLPVIDSIIGGAVRLVDRRGGARSIAAALLAVDPEPRGRENHRKILIGVASKPRVLEVVLERFTPLKSTQQLYTAGIRGIQAHHHHHLSTTLFSSACLSLIKL